MLPIDRMALRPKLIAARQALPDRLERAVQLQGNLRVWLVGRQEQTIGGYWPIKGEFDPPAGLVPLVGRGRRPAHRPAGGRQGERLAALPCLVPRAVRPNSMPTTSRMPKGTEVFAPQMLLLPCVGYGPGGVRLGYGGGFYDRTIMALRPRPYTVGLCYANAFLPMLRAEPDDLPLDALITDDGVGWQREE